MIQIKSELQFYHLLSGENTACPTNLPEGQMSWKCKRFDLRNESTHLPIFPSHSLVSSQTRLLARAVEFSGCFLKLHFGCRVTERDRFGTQRVYLAHACGWHRESQENYYCLWLPFSVPRSLHGTIFLRPFQFWGSVEAPHRGYSFHKSDHRVFSCVDTFLTPSGLLGGEWAWGGS
jgi:hypothetical protein